MSRMFARPCSRPYNIKAALRAFRRFDPKKITVSSNSKSPSSTFDSLLGSDSSGLGRCRLHLLGLLGLLGLRRLGSIGCSGGSIGRSRHDGLLCLLRLSLLF